jgi:restriction system protein
MAAHTTRARTTRRPGLWGWTALILTTAGALKTWPIPAGIILGLAAATLITHAIRPARLAPLWRALGRTTRHHTRLPDAGYRTLQNFHRMTPADFEHAIAELALEDHRVHTAHRVGGANDRGADVLIHLHDGRRILIQCKHHQPGNNVSSGVVQTINGVYRDLHHCHHAVIVTTAAFTRAAHETNNRLPYAIRLIDGTALTSWANGHTPAPW